MHSIAVTVAAAEAAAAAVAAARHLSTAHNVASRTLDRVSIFNESNRVHIRLVANDFTVNRLTQSARYIEAEHANTRAAPRNSKISKAANCMEITNQRIHISLQQHVNPTVVNQKR